ncbi:hypothetical protein PHYPSEUDO_002091 [Phytophthora pseudosyringae]|uniref:M96 mating-specific protein family n=1 Tax=Phytophthora pseudosyringae TaxID=221518 RepID=A0A8T1VUC3_9STRA|nr:hypothetical protein PHYPSEUDO_002091 [Phytophthora pseudosyringae]
MTDLITTDEVLFDDIVGLLDFNDPLTPRPLSAGDTNAPTASLFTANVRSPNPSTGSSDDGSETDRHRKKREKEKTRQRRYRQRLRDGRDELQQQVDELSKELLRLSKQAANKKAVGSSTEALATTKWVAEAVRQLEQRSHSEAEHKRLIAAVNHQAAYINQLRQVLGGQQSDNAVPGAGSGSAASFNYTTPTLHAMTNALYTTYLQQLEGCYARVDNVLDVCGMTSLPEMCVNSTHNRKADGQVAYFEHLNKLTLPYSFKQTCQALWTAIYEVQEPALEGDKLAPDDDVFVKSRVLRSTNVGALPQRFIARFYKEENRLVLVWKMSAEGEGGFKGLHAEETAWMCVRPAPSGVILEVCVQQVPMRYNVAHGQSPAIDRFHKLLRESLEADKLDLCGYLERLLLDNVLAGIEC